MLSITAAVLLSVAQPPVPANAIAPTDWKADAEALLVQKRAQRPINKRARNVILFVGDGMDVTTVTAARILAGQKLGGPGENHVLQMETLPHVALSKTYNTDAQTPDSAGTATAMMTGYKSSAGVLNVSERARIGACADTAANLLEPLSVFAAARGRSIGVISTARITHATPATVYAHSVERDWESDGDLPADATACTDIATQLVEAMGRMPIKIALGGGRANFLPNGAADPEYPDRRGARKDGTDLTARFLAQHPDNRLIVDRAGFDAVRQNPGNAVLGLFEPSHMQYEADRAADRAGEPSLAEMTSFAIEQLNKDRDGFFLMVEGGRVDHAHHAGNAARALEDTIAFDAAIAAALAATDPRDTLIIVTADHGHTMAFQGYQVRGNPILGLVHGPDADGGRNPDPQLAADGKPYTTLGYANGPGSPFLGKQGPTAERPSVTEAEATAINYRQQAVIPSPSETHGGQDVAIYARGPMAYLVDGVVEQNFIYYVMREAITGGK